MYVRSTPKHHRSIRIRLRGQSLLARYERVKRSLSLFGAISWALAAWVPNHRALVWFGLSGRRSLVSILSVLPLLLADAGRTRARSRAPYRVKTWRICGHVARSDASDYAYRGFWGGYRRRRKDGTRDAHLCRLSRTFGVCAVWRLGMRPES